MKTRHLRKCRLLRRRLADKLILALWLLGALFATTTLVRADSSPPVSQPPAATRPLKN